MNPEMKDGITIALAAFGAGLGLFNAARAWARDRPRLKIVPRVYVTNQGDQGFCIEVINIGGVALQVTQVGFELPDNQIFLFVPRFLDKDVSLPHRLDARAMITVYAFGAVCQDPKLAQIGRAFAKTAGNGIFYGSDRTFRSYAKKIGSAR